jgi:hypothetical protein
MNEYFTQFLIAQSLMSRPHFDGYDYEDIWTTAGSLLAGYLESDISNQGTDFQMIDKYLDGLSIHELQQLEQ